MQPTFHFSQTLGPHSPDWTMPVAFVVVYAFALFALLYRVLTREDFDAPNKILWVIVLLGAPFMGFLLYLFAAPTPLPQRNSTRASRAVHGDNLSGTPWADDPNYTKPS